MQDPIILPYLGKVPQIDPSAWIAPGAVVIGDVTIGPESSVWYGTVIRGDINRIRIGRRVNLQDGVICHVNEGDAELVIEDNASVGHAAVLHGCQLREGCLVGIGARVLDHSVIGVQALVAAGSVVREGTQIPDGELWAGIPAIRKRDLSPEDKQALNNTAEHYVKLRLHHAGMK